MGVHGYLYGNVTMGLLATLIGMGGVFIILGILTFTTWLLNKVVDSIVKDPAPAAPKAAAPAAAPAAAAKANNNAKIAAIMAAVSVAMGSSEPLHFTAIQRTGGAMLPWAASGNANIMADRASYTKGGNK